GIRDRNVTGVQTCALPISSDTPSLTGKKAIITGAGKGIGRATALALAKEGVSLGLLARTEEDLKKVADEVNDSGVQVAIATADEIGRASCRERVKSAEGCG